MWDSAARNSYRRGERDEINHEAWRRSAAVKWTLTEIHTCGMFCCFDTVVITYGPILPPISWAAIHSRSLLIIYSWRSGWEQSRGAFLVIDRTLRSGQIDRSLKSENIFFITPAPPWIVLYKGCNGRLRNSQKPATARLLVHIYYSIP